MALKIFVSKINDGSMKSVHSGEIDKVNQARANFLKKNNIDPNETTLVRLSYNSDDYKRYFTVDNSLKGDGIVRASTFDSDAVVVTKKNHALFLPLADCIGAVIYSPSKNILMVSHLGRHNLEQFGGTASIKYLIDKFNVNPDELKIWLSPAAGKQSYPLFGFKNRSLHEVAVEQIIAAGVPLKSIDASTIDSAEHPHFYSHSQFLKGNQLDDGRFAIVAIIAE